jgi:hypothetical protein
MRFTTTVEPASHTRSGQVSIVRCVLASWRRCCRCREAGAATCTEELMQLCPPPPRSVRGSTGLGGTSSTSTPTAATTLASFSLTTASATTEGRARRFSSVSTGPIAATARRCVSRCRRERLTRLHRTSVTTLTSVTLGPSATSALASGTTETWRAVGRCRVPRACRRRRQLRRLHRLHPRRRRPRFPFLRSPTVRRVRARVPTRSRAWSTVVPSHLTWALRFRTATRRRTR